MLGAAQDRLRPRRVRRMACRFGFAALAQPDPAAGGAVVADRAPGHGRLRTQAEILLVEGLDGQRDDAGGIGGRWRGVQDVAVSATAVHLVVRGGVGPHVFAGLVEAPLAAEDQRRHGDRLRVDPNDGVPGAEDAYLVTDAKMVAGPGPVCPGGFHGGEHLAPVGDLLAEAGDLAVRAGEIAGCGVGAPPAVGVLAVPTSGGHLVAGALPAAKVSFETFDPAGDHAGVVPVPLGRLGRAGTVLPVVADRDLGTGRVLGPVEPLQVIGVAVADHRLAERNGRAALADVVEAGAAALVPDVGQLGVPLDPPGDPCLTVGLDLRRRAGRVVNAGLDRVAGGVQRLGEAFDAGPVGVAVAGLRQVPGPVRADVAGELPPVADGLEHEVGAVASGGAVHDGALGVAVLDGDHGWSPSGWASAGWICSSIRWLSRRTRSSSSRNRPATARYPAWVGSTLRWSGCAGRSGWGRSAPASASAMASRHRCSTFRRQWRRNCHSSPLSDTDRSPGSVMARR